MSQAVIVLNMKLGEQESEISRSITPDWLILVDLYYLRVFYRSPSKGILLENVQGTVTREEQLGPESLSISPGAKIFGRDRRNLWG